MKDYDIVKLEDQNAILVIMHTCDSPFDYLPEIAWELKKLNYSGVVIFDELLHSGNNEERFINCVFNEEDFITESFQFFPVNKQAVLRKYMCDYLRKDIEYLQSSSLSSAQIKLIEKECVI